MDVILIESDALHFLIEKVISRIKEDLKEEQKWIDTGEAMRILHITSKTTLQRLRDTGAIRFSQPQKKVIIYDKESINSYLESHVKNTF